jgi:glycerophosphoryl diester phosphodiesterase
MPSLIAHRGYPRRYPENTLAGIEAAIAAGARYFEIDVQLSADGVPMVFHDDELQRLCGVPGHITGFSLADIRSLRVGGELVPTLAELVGLLRRHPDVHAFVELKQESIDVAGETALLAAVADALAPVRARCTMISFNATVLKLAVEQGWAVGWVTAAWPDAFPAGLEHGLAVWFCDEAALPPDGPLNASGVPLAVYEVADPDTARRLVARGAAFIESFDIGGMRRALADWT